MIVEFATESDAAEVLQVVAQLLTELSGMPCSLDESCVLPVIRDAMRDGHYAVVLARDTDRSIAGVLTAGETVAAYAGGTFGVIHELYVRPSLRSTGVGKRLLDEAKVVCRKRGWTRLEVGAPHYPEWARTKEFYLREGFSEIGPRMKWVAEQRTTAHSVRP